jgi:hypothetical protein
MGLFLLLPEAARATYNSAAFEPTNRLRVSAKGVFMSMGMRGLPRARREGLNVQAVGSEVLVFDSTNEMAHALNGPAAFVWQNADGTKSVDELARLMTREFGVTADAQVVWYALEQLQKRELLETAVSAPVEWRGMTRRQFLKRATAGAVLLAVVTSIVAPTPAHAQSGCVGEGGTCTDSNECCPGLICCFAGAGQCFPDCGT